MTSITARLRDPDFCKQILKASAKAAPQVAEGFLRVQPKGSAYYYVSRVPRWARRQSHLLRGRHRKYWSEEVFKKAWESVKVR
jgi:hypothetical protein